MYKVAYGLGSDDGSIQITSKFDDPEGIVAGTGTCSFTDNGDGEGGGFGGGFSSGNTGGDDGRYSLSVDTFIRLPFTPIEMKLKFMHL